MSSSARKPLFIISLLAVAAISAFLFSRISTAQESPQQTVQIPRWEYTIVRVESPSKAEASIAQLNRYGAEGWEAVELLPPAYDILMKRPRGR